MSSKADKSSEEETDPTTAPNKRESNRRYGIGIVRAFGGALLFALPMIMTMEMWWLGFYAEPARLAVYTLLGIPLLIGLSYFAGFEESSEIVMDVLDAFTALAIGFVVATLLLMVFAIIGPGMSADEIIGKIVIQAAPASLGAMLARSQFGEKKSKEETRRSANYLGGMFIVAVGALFLASNLASAEEMILISYKMTAFHVVVLIVLSLLVMHGFVHAVVVTGRSPLPAEVFPFWIVFFRFTMVGYAISLLMSVFILWIFGRTDGLAVGQILQETVVLGFPAAVGAGAARLII